MIEDQDRCYRAVSARDARFDGVFYTAVTSTGIYCRPSCPARTPKRSNVRFYASAAAAHDAGFRACRRCRPDAAPGSPEWDVRSDTVGRAMRLIRDGVVERDGVTGLAARLGYSTRHVNRMLVDEVGAGPLALARSNRAHHARILIETTDVPITDIAFAAGFASVRQFNETLRTVYDASPTSLREVARRRARGGGATGSAPSSGRITLRLAVRTPFDHESLLAFLARRAVDGLEAVRDGTYARTLRLPHGSGVVALTLAADHVRCALELADLRDTMAAVARCRSLLDLDADPVAIDEVLGSDPALGPDVAARPGLRVPGHVDGYELAVRAVVGQQVSVAGARTTLGRIVADHGSPLEAPTPLAHAYGLTRLFPEPDRLATTDPSTLGMPRTRAATVAAIADAVAVGKLDLGTSADRAALREALLEIRGIGVWTADYVLMRATRDPDVLLADDLVVRRRLTERGIDPASTTTWSPWRSYAAVHLWSSTERRTA
ncbi:AraC family transcriptional regulator of adaptative response / DNA-3-methyladenine glycosylase II [Mumia flava]|uniref:DNA-3-methyladenine glycosylase II n=1 Tax=Mumia flava TaxID=1348852 RepID=A0A0B2BBY7_9ACTN|nr:AlkA N-terminal domain-containing protein [Mumia flava]PJJ53873.1 AraC family transcriptional regulator of adaptative response / DNA-3-methyladenine glycosylase II [Mumia flava]